MKIFDGVELKPTPGSNMQNWLSLAVVVANSIIEAEKHRQERVAGATTAGPSTLDEVMGQAGLNIPGLEEVLAQLMGGGDEAKQAASMIVHAPDPGKLLQQFAKQFGFAGAANSGPTGPVVTPPPAGPEPPVVNLSKFRPDFTREARQAARATAASGSEGQLSKFRPDLTREARQAARAATATASEPQAARAPEPPAGGVESDGPVPTSAATSRPSLVNLVKRQLAALRQRMNAHEEALDARLERAEAELAALRQEFEQGAKPALVVVAAEERETAEPTIVEAAGEQATETTQLALELVEPEPSLDLEEPLPAATEEEVVEAAGLISAFAAECEVRYQKGIARVLAVEHEVQAMRSRAQTEATAVHG